MPESIPGVAEIFPMASENSMCLGADSASKSEYQDIPGGKGGRCVSLTTYHFHLPIVKKFGGLNFMEPCGPLQACNETALPFHSFHRQSGLILRICEEMIRMTADPGDHAVYCVELQQFVDWHRRFEYSSHVFVLCW